MVASDMVGIIATFGKYSPVGGPAIGILGSTGAVVLGIVGRLMNKHGVYYMEMPDGRLLRLTPLSA